MKAILVIDMPEDMSIEDTRALHLTLFNGMFTKDIKINCPLKPMPKRWNGVKVGNHLQIVKARMFEGGWNACLEEIEK